MTISRLRKAAILVASLDSRSADTLLDQFPPEQAMQVRNAIMELGEVDTTEQQAILEEFVSQGSPGATTQPDTGVELSESLQDRLQSASSQPHRQATDPGTETQTPARPFRWLENVAPEVLSSLLTREHPQTAAIAVAHLPTARAPEVLARLPVALQADILSRIARLDQANPEVLQDVEREMETQLAGYTSAEPFEQSGLATVSAIVQAADTLQQRDLITGLAERDRRLARHLSTQPPEPHAVPARRFDTSFPTTDAPDRQAHSSDSHRERHHEIFGDTTEASSPNPQFLPTFSDLEQLPSNDLAQLLQAADQETILLALAGASHSFVQRLLHKLPSREAARFNARIQNLGPLRLTDVDVAQRELSQLASKLMQEGVIGSPPGKRFAVAV